MTNGSSESPCGGRLVCLKNIAACEPDMVYSYLSTAIEVDALCECTSDGKSSSTSNSKSNFKLGSELCGILRCTQDIDRYKLGLIAIEEVSNNNEALIKPLKRSLLTPTPILNWLWIDKGKLDALGEVHQINPLMHLVASELINLLFYAMLTMSPDRAYTIKTHFKKTMQLVGLLSNETDTTCNCMLADIIKILDSNTGDKNEHGNAIKNHLDELKEALCEWLKNKAEEMQRICNARIWVVLVQSGVWRRRLNSIIGSIKLLQQSICSLLSKNKLYRRNIVYYFSKNVLQRMEKEEKGSVDDIFKIIEENDGFVCKDYREGMPSSMKSCMERMCISELTEHAEASKAGTDKEDVVILVFGDYSKKFIHECYKTGIRFIVIPESTYVKVGYELTSYFGYLRGLEIVANIISKSDNDLKKELEELAKCIGVEDVNKDKDKILVVLFLLKAAI